jgi:hypothetical protein
MRAPPPNTHTHTQALELWGKGTPERLDTHSARTTLLFAQCCVPRDAATLSRRTRQLGAGARGVPQMP